MFVIGIKTYQYMIFMNLSVYVFKEITFFTKVEEIYFNYHSRTHISFFLAYAYNCIWQTHKWDILQNRFCFKGVFSLISKTPKHFAYIERVIFHVQELHYGMVQ